MIALRVTSGLCSLFAAVLLRLFWWAVARDVREELGGSQQPCTRISIPAQLSLFLSSYGSLRSRRCSGAASTSKTETQENAVVAAQGKEWARGACSGRGALGRVGGHAVGGRRRRLGVLVRLWVGLARHVQHLLQLGALELLRRLLQNKLKAGQAVLSCQSGGRESPGWKVPTCVSQGRPAGGAGEPGQRGAAAGGNGRAGAPFAPCRARGACAGWARA